MVVESTFSAPVDGIVHQEASTRLFINLQEVGIGTLYITENAVIWGDATSSRQSVQLDYRSISVHAVQSQPVPSLFLMLDYQLKLPGLSGDDTQESSDCDDEDLYSGDSAITEVRFVPQQSTSLSPMYQAMNYCQTLHPDPEDVDSDYLDGEDPEEREEFMDAEESSAQQDDAAAQLGSLRIQQSNGNSNGNHNAINDADDVENEADEE